MNRWGLAPFALAAFASAYLGGARAGRGDLFAVASSTGQILRIDSATLEVTHTYDNPYGPVVPATYVGVAFDGRTLSWTNSLGAIASQELYQFDVVSETWGPPIPLFDVSPPHRIAGLGALGSDAGGALLGIAGTPPGSGIPAIFYRIEPFGLAVPLGELPPQYNVQGLDIDSATGDIWVGARNIELSPEQFELLRVRLPIDPPTLTVLSLQSAEMPLPAVAEPVIEQAILAAFTPPAALRGVAFDDSRMFVIAGNRTLAEVDRATGAILRSVQLPGRFQIGGLSGGTVVPEPSGMIMLALAVVGAIRFGRPERSH